MYVMYYAPTLQCWQLIRILVRTNHPCLRVGRHRLYPLRDSSPLPPPLMCCTHVGVVPQLRDQLRPESVGHGRCLTRRLPVAQAPVSLDLQTYR
jgi:hypothetical protein